MNVRHVVSKWLSATPLTGMPMLLCVVAALAAPTLIRASVEGVVTGVGFTPYLPFVLLAALMLRWQVAAAVAVASAVLADFLFVGTRHELLSTPTDLFGMLVFAAASALTIGLAHAFRRVVADPIWLNGPDHPPTGLVFSLEGGQVYASWYGGRSFVPVGPEAEVAKMMQDFLAQREVGRRLARRSGASRRLRDGSGA